LQTHFIPPSNSRLNTHTHIKFPGHNHLLGQEQVTTYNHLQKTDWQEPPSSLWLSASTTQEQYSLYTSTQVQNNYLTPWENHTSIHHPKINLSCKGIPTQTHLTTT
jgi:hypothetical protein